MATQTGSLDLKSQKALYEIADIAAGDAKAASDAADDAAKAANNAAESAAIALTQLDIIENVVGVLNLVSKNGDYQVTTDTTVQPDKWYFTLANASPPEYAVVSNPTEIQYALTTDQSIDSNKHYYTRSGSGTTEDPYVYTMVTNPDVSEIGTYYECIYYELAGINQAVQNYVSSHLVLDGGGLWLQMDGSSSKLQLSPSGGVVIHNENNQRVAQYGVDTIIGNLDDPNGFRIKIDSNNNEIGFYEGDDSILTNRIAYMSGYELYVRNRLSFGHFQFIERENGHFTLKLVD